MTDNHEKARYHAAFASATFSHHPVKMPKRYLLAAVLLLCLVFASALARAEPTRDERKVAFIVGNATYNSGPLLNPVNDARAVAKALAGLGFEVTVKENFSVREIGSIYREFRAKLPRKGIGLFFYAGHGIQFKGQNFFPAIDAELAGEEDVPLQSLNLGQILDTMEDAKLAVNLVLLDACRDNPFARRFRSASRGLAKIESASGMLIHYATRPGSVASDGAGKNGTYTEALLKHIAEPDLPVEMMLKKVANTVVDQTGGKQEPWIEGSLRGDFFFALAKVPGMPALPAASPRPATGVPPAPQAQAQAAPQLAEQRLESKNSPPEPLKAAPQALSQAPQQAPVQLAERPARPAQALNLSYRVGQNAEGIVTIDFDHPPPRFETFSIANPPRLAIDLAGVSLAPEMEKNLAVNDAKTRIKAVNALINGNRVRFVIAGSDRLDKLSVVQDGNRLLITAPASQGESPPVVR